MSTVKRSKTPNDTFGKACKGCQLEAIRASLSPADHFEILRAKLGVSQSTLLGKLATERRNAEDERDGTYTGKEKPYTVAFCDAMFPKVKAAGTRAKREDVERDIMADWENELAAAQADAVKRGKSGK